MKRILLAVLMALCLHPIAAHALSLTARLDGDGLYAACEKSDTVCRYFVMGVVDVLNSGAVSEAIGVCVKSHVTVPEMTNVVKRYLNDRPDQRQRMAWEIVMQAIQKAFPCD
jgi:hypothetical protein